MIEDAKELADYYEDLVNNITQFSFVVNKDGSFTEGNSTNGLGSRFPIGGIPHADTDKAKAFRGRLLASGMKGMAGMFEYRRPGWTFHGKGLWVSE